MSKSALTMTVITKLTISSMKRSRAKGLANQVAAMREWAKQSKRVVQAAAPVESRVLKRAVSYRVYKNKNKQAGPAVRLFVNAKKSEYAHLVSYGAAGKLGKSRAHPFWTANAPALADKCYKKLAQVPFFA